MPGPGSTESIDKPDAYIEMRNPNRIFEASVRESVGDVGYANVREAQGIAGLERVQQPMLEVWDGEPAILPITPEHENIYNIPPRTSFSKAVLREPTSLDDLNGIMENLYTEQETLVVSVKHERMVRNMCIGTGIFSLIAGLGNGIVAGTAALGGLTLPTAGIALASGLIGATCVGGGACISYGVKEDQQLTRHQKDLLAVDNRIKRIDLHQMAQRPVVSEFIPEPPSRPQSFRHNSTSRSSRNASESSHL